MSYIYLPGQVVESSVESCSVTSASAPSNGTNTAKPSCSRGKKTVSSLLSQYGTISEVLTDDRGGDWLTLYLEGFRASRSVPLASERENTTSGTCGPTPSESYARFDPVSRSWRTCQDSTPLEGSLLWFLRKYGSWAFLGKSIKSRSQGDSIVSCIPLSKAVISEPSFVIFTKRGSMRNGMLSEPTMLERPTIEKDSGFWPTPRVTTGDYTRDGGVHGKERQTLEGMVKMFPTPKATDGTHGGPNARDKSGRPHLSKIAAMFPTPTAPGPHQVGKIEEWGGSKNPFRKWRTPNARDGMPRGHQSPEKRLAGGHQPGLGDQVGGTLSPTWVELLMGWPKDWTCLTALPIVEFKKWLMGFSNENLQDMRYSSREEAIQRSSRGCGSIHKEAVLLSEMREHKDGPDEKRVAMEGQGVSEKELRSVQNNHASTSSPREREYQGRSGKKPANPVHPLPSVSPSYGKEAWANGSWEAGIERIARGVINRVDRLKAIGNGQVPLVAYTAWNTLMNRIGSGE